MEKSKTVTPERPSRAGKYLKYAVGEVLLVVVGILIALQINNGNEIRKTKLKTQEYINEIVNDIATDTLNINALISRGNIYEEDIERYFSYFNQGNIPIQELIDSSKNVDYSWMRYFPVSHTFMDMQTSGNTNLLSKTQRKALIDLSSEQNYLQIIIEKTINNSINEFKERDKQLGYPFDFYAILGQIANDHKKLQWLLHQHLGYRNNLLLYGYIGRRGNRIKEKSKKTIQILKGEDIDN